MQDFSNKRDSYHLIRQVLNRTSDVSNFALFLGAGASKTSQIKSAEEMVDEWREELYTRSNSKESYEDWIGKQNWYNDDDEYSMLFERMYDQPSQRRVYIEECVKNAHPNWGYIYLTNLLAKKFFDVVFTTNFDDLLNEACYLYSVGLKPIVAAHDSAVSGIRVTSHRPKIIKLHGDFLYDNIKNTVRELETLEENSKKKLAQFALEYGLVVVGYGGRDRSVMDVLEVLLKSEDYLKQGVYWCVKEGTQPGKRVQSLLRRDRVYLVEVRGFDEFMAQIHETAGLKLPDPVANPFKVARERVRFFMHIPDSLKADRIIAKHTSEVLKAVREGPKEFIPIELQGVALKESGDLDGAIENMSQAFKENPEDASIALELAKSLSSANKKDDLLEFLKTAPLDAANKSYFMLLANENENVIEIVDRALAANPANPLNEFGRINKAIALKRLGKKREMEDEIRRLEASGIMRKPFFSVVLAAGMSALRNNKADMLKHIKRALLQRQITPINVRTYPVFEDYKEDKELEEILREAEKQEQTRDLSNSAH